MAAIRSPEEWLAHIGQCETCSKCAAAGVTGWIGGDKKPRRRGWYDRLFHDGVFRHWWDGTYWRSQRYAEAHWRQVGDYPCWRGLSAKPKGAP